MPAVELSRQALRDLRRLDVTARGQIVEAIDGLAAGTPNLEVKALAGHPGWLRLRSRDWRVLYRKHDAGGWWVERVVNRRDLDRTVRAL